MKSDLKYSMWMITIMHPDGGLLPLASLVEDVFSQEGADWVYQLETHENSKEENKQHYQCCLRTFIRTRKDTLLRKLSENLSHPVDYIRVENVKGTWQQAVMYCSKTETKAAETEMSPSVRATQEVTYYQQDVRILNYSKERYPWQNRLLSLLFDDDNVEGSPPRKIRIPDDRTIIWISDPVGNSGKSKLVKYIAANNPLATKISFGTANQLRSSIIAQGPKKLYFIDIPRTIGKDDSLNDVLSVCEELKNAYVTSSFYGNHTQLLFDPPHVVIFSNAECPIHKLSGDRWETYTIRDRNLILTGNDSRLKEEILAKYSEIFTDD